MYICMCSSIGRAGSMPLTKLPVYGVLCSRGVVSLGGRTAALQMGQWGVLISQSHKHLQEADNTIVMWDKMLFQEHSKLRLISAYAYNT